MNILTEIAAYKREEIERRKAARPLPLVEQAATTAQPALDLRAALVHSGRPAPRIIAEIKRRSPSKGPLRADLDAAEVARTYEANGASAISVLCDARYFGGSLGDLRAVRSAVRVPVLCKEFILDAYQIYEAREAGADAVLLISALLDTHTLREYRRIAARLGMATIVEVHDDHELESALTSGADLVGINNRDLRTFAVDLETTRTLLPVIPSGVITVSESGIRTSADRALMAALGVDALLVGESLITSADIAAATREISGLAPALQEVTRHD